MYVNEPVVETPSNPQKILNDPRNNFTGFTYVQNDILNQSYIDDSKLKLNNKN
jgi:Protein kinase C terminal domain.